MSAATDLDWPVTAQWGVRHAADADPSPLVHPGFAQWTTRDTCLLIDQGQAVNRVLEVDRGGRIVWSHEAPPRMNWAHRLDDDTVLVLQGDGLWSVRGDGATRLLYRVPTRSHLNCASLRDGVVAIGADDGIFLVTIDGRPLRVLRPSESTFIETYDIELLAGGHLLIVDAYGSCAVELDENGRRVTVFGAWRQSSPDRAALMVPAATCRRADGTTVVADWRNGLLVEHAPDGQRIRALASAGRAMHFAPTCVRETPSGELLVADAGNRRVCLRDDAGRILWEHGPFRLPVTDVRFPRTAEPLSGGGLLVTDCYADRVIALTTDHQVVWECGPDGASGEDPGLALPRAAARGRSGTAIADGLNRRLVVAGSDGAIVREVSRIDYCGSSVTLGDPHYAEELGPGELLLVDADLDRVVVLDEADRVLHDWGGARGGLRDPHMASVLTSGELLVADSGNSRVVRLDRDGAVVSQLTHYRDADGERHALSTPRCVRPLPGGRLLVVDTNGCQVLCVDWSGRLLWKVGPQLDVSLLPAVSPELRTPKWAAMDAAGRLLITDYFNSRVVRTGRGDRGGR